MEISSSGQTEDHLQAYYATTFQCMSEGVVIFDANLNVLNANPAFLKMFRISDFDKLKACWEEFKNHLEFFDLNGSSIPYDNWPFQKVFNNVSPVAEKYKVVRRDIGYVSYVSCNGYSNFDKHNELHFGVLCLQDITKDVNLEKELNDKLEESRQFEQVLTDSQNRLKGERELLQTLINSIPVMITIYDPGVKEIQLNKAVEDITGWTLPDTEKASIMSLAYPDPDYRQEVAEYMKSLEPGFKDIIMRTKDGRDIETSWANIMIPDGRQVGIGIDVSERIAAEKEIIAAKEKAENAANVQAAFLQNVSHEVRTPMNSILGFTGLLQKSIKSIPEKDYLDAIKYNGNQLLRLIDDIVDLSRMDNNELMLEKKAVFLSKVIYDSKQQFEGLKLSMNKQQLEFRENIPEEKTGIGLNADVDRIQQVITNLVSNAVKYTEEGYIELGYEVLRDKKQVMFYLKDTGQGIPENDQHKVFKRFEQFNGDKTRHYGGTGLGLAICKNLVKLWGGEIWFESEPSKGTTFYFTHPYDEQEQVVMSDDSEEEDVKSDAPDLAGKTILVAEDDFYSYMMMHSILMETKAEVLHAEDGEAAVDLFSENHTDFVFLDIRLPKLDGYEVLKIIRQTKRSIPVIALTAHAMSSDKEKSRKAGFDYHATKPVSMDDLYKLLNRFLREDREKEKSN